MPVNMSTESPMRMMSESSVRTITVGDSSTATIPLSPADSVAQELGMLLRSHSRLDNLLNHKDVVPHRSGSAPPSVEGSIAARGGFLLPGMESLGAHIIDSQMPGQSNQNVIDSEQELRSDPAYLAYYYSHINLNPRLPPPILSRENYVLAQRLANGNLPDRKNLRSFDDNNKRSLFSTQPGLPIQNEIESSEDATSPEGILLRQVSSNWMERKAEAGSSVAYTHGLNARPKSLVDLIQQDFPRTPSPVYSLPRSSSTVANEEGKKAGGDSHLRDSSVTGTAVAELDSPLLHVASRSVTPSLKTPTSALPLGNAPTGSGSGNLGPIARVPTPEPLSVKEALIEEISSSRMGASSSDLTSCLQDLTLHEDLPPDHKHLVGLSLDHHPQEPQEQPSLRQHIHHNQHGQRSQARLPFGQVKHVHALQQQQTSEHNFTASSKYGTLLSQSLSAPIQSSNNKFAAAIPYIARENPYYEAASMYSSQYGLSGYSMNNSLFPGGAMPNYSNNASYENVTAGLGTRSASTGIPSVDMQQLYKYTSKNAGPLQARVSDSIYLHYLQQRASDDVHGIDSLLRGGYGQLNPLEVQKNHQLSSMRSYSQQDHHKSQFVRGGAVGLQMGSQTGSISPGYYGSPPGLGFVMPYANSPLSSPVFPGSPVLPGALSLRHSGRSSVNWQGVRAGEAGEDMRASSLLDELKNSKSRRFELQEIAGHVVEFSADQHGSRFIQQKLEMASDEEKDMVFQEVLPHALILMTDVFGNYVIQKFFEHESMEQRTELANKLVGHVLNLSLQMYGCRVIQKALEVVGKEQQISLVTELDGYVMHCVRDQNGNHVIQKCIECIPPEHIQFIISAFRGHVVTLSTHPYGCRVIQRVLEHCTIEQKDDGIMDDILQATCDLAQDQYGNYVVQHVLEHGKPHEKGEIMTKLAGQIVQMSQHKFASNVVEKCLEFGGPIERGILISEMIGHTDENEPLQAMMKDQYANYVVQKVLETCNDQERELLLTRIRIHLHALKKYTYGKHIVARVEKLVAAGERRSAQVSSLGA